MPGECNQTKDANSVPVCVNCGEEGHPASWRGCSYYNNYVLNKKQRLREAQNLKTIAKNNVGKYVSAAINPSKSFASLFHRNSIEKLEPSRPLIVDALLKLSEFFLEPEELTLEQELDNFLKEYKNKPKSEAKVEFLQLLRKVKSIHGP